MKEILFKSLETGTVKDVSKTSRTVTGYYSSFGQDPDSDNDVMSSTAFAQTLKMNGPEGANRIWHLFNHSTSSPINKPYILKTDDFGLYFETKFPDTKIANDILTLYQEGAITEHSIGFNIIQARQEQGVQGQFQLIQEVRLWEGSSVLWGANQNTPTVGMKAEDFAVKASILDNLLHNGDLSDEMFEQLEKMLSDIKAMFRTSDPEPEQNNTTTCVPEVEIINSFYKSLNLRK